MAQYVYNRYPPNDYFTQIYYQILISKLSSKNVKHFLYRYEGSSKGFKPHPDFRFVAHYMNLTFREIDRNLN